MRPVKRVVSSDHGAERTSSDCVLPPAGVNPFSTRWVKPGRIKFRFPDGQSTESLADRLSGNEWWGQIVGPHGTGKSNLLCQLVPEIRARGRTIVLAAMHNGERKLPWSWRDAESWNARTQVVIDGYEQLWWPARAWIRRCCRRSRAGLLVTGHRPVGLPPLWTTAVSAELAFTLVSHLTGQHPGLITPDQVAASHARHQGNLREIFFEMYDLFAEHGDR